MLLGFPSASKIRFSQESIRTELLFTGNIATPSKIQADGYTVHSFLIENSQSYQNKKEVIFQLLKDAYYTT